MNNTFTKSFINTLVFNIATIVAVIVAVVSYTYKAARVWYADGGKEFLMSAAAKFTLMCHKLSERVYYTLEDAELA